MHFCVNSNGNGTSQPKQHSNTGKTLSSSSSKMMGHPPPWWFQCDQSFKPQLIHTKFMPGFLNFFIKFPIEIFRKIKRNHHLLCTNIRQGYKNPSFSECSGSTCLLKLPLCEHSPLTAGLQSHWPSFSSWKQSGFHLPHQHTAHDTLHPTRYEINFLTPHFDFHFLKAALHDQSIQNSSFLFFLTVPHYFLSFII